ncbi:MAG TPA: carbohydrate ABC transporter permease [Caldilineae bacterium]|nr:carbohydrate ABC transporter permease [Caldilineae bacterium]
MAESLAVDVAKRQVRRGRLTISRSVGQRTVTYFLLFFISILVIVPLMWAFAASFTPNDKVFQYVFPFSWRALFPVDFTLEAYRSLFLEEGFTRPVVNTLILGFSTVILSGVTNALAGFAFARFDFRGKDLLFGIVLLTFMIPGEVTMIPLYIVVSRLGLVNTWTVLIVPGLANSLIIFLFRQFFAEIPQDLIDAARVDGASWLKVFTSIVLPMSKPVLITASLLLFLGQWNSFFWPLLVAPDPRLRVVQVAVSYAYEEHQTLWNQLLAGSIMAAFVPILLVLPFQRYYVSGLVGSGLKE